MPKNGVKIKRWRKKKNVLMCQVSQLLWKKMIGEFVDNKWLDSIADTSQVTVGFLILKDKTVREPSAMSFPTPAADCEDVRDYSNYKLLFGEKKFSKSHSASSVTSWEFEDKTRL